MLRGAWVQDVQINLPIGSIIQDRYSVEELLGKGGFGAVYLVKDLRVKGNLFALKEIVDTSKKERERFRFECEVLKRLDHPALPRVYRTFEDTKTNRAYMLMDYVNGSNLEVLRHQQPQKRFSLARAIGIMSPIVDAVKYMHQQHPPLIHRDIKPANIIVPDDDGQAVLVDLGIAKEYHQDATTTAIRRCSPGYGAPEQYAKGTNPRTDIYGLGATFYVLLTGEVPTDAVYRMTQLGSKHTDPLPPVHQLVPAIPPSISAAIQQAMAIDSKDRFASVEEFWQALTAEPVQQPADASMMHNAPTVVVRQPFDDARKKRKLALLLLFIALALFALAGGIVLGNGLLSMPQSVHHPPVTVGGRATTVVTVTTSSHRVASPVASSPVQTATPTHSAVTATVPPTQIATPNVNQYPTLADSYTGSISDQAYNPAVEATMQLQNVRQNGATLRGYFSVSSELNGSGNLQGNVTTDNKVQFTVNSYQNNSPLFFQGTIRNDGSMSGTYCSYQNGHCNDLAGGHGTWHVTINSQERGS
ncbi:hypothetical protein KSF_013110 [Reticulibacter mediterranei]|uniref:non-specific serine/threonine protein kinase n=1 Tax=Reticulibacter mediterranei TaxID=2778369 RepID=A0A8J3ID11_9CHLR|nr:hypothetical protein KSF_013110 [Reticulibacter mediterranei]